MTRLVALKHDPVPGVVECCEQMLELAKSGEVRSVAVVAQLAGGSTSTAYDNSEGDRAHLVYAIERLKFRLMTEEG